VLTSAATIRPLRASDRDAVVAAGREVFGHTAFSVAAWRWSYEESPFGRQALVWADGDEVLGLFAARNVRARAGSESLRLGLAIDVFVHPRAWRGLERGARFERLASTFFERFGTTEYDALYGWPAPAALRFGLGRLGFERLEPELAWVGSARSLAGSDDAQGLVADEVATCVDGLGALGRRVVAPGTLAIERDERWMRWRFDRHPVHAYRRFVVRDPRSGAPRGFCVARGGAGLPRGVFGVALWLVGEEDPSCAHALVRAVARAAREDEASELAFVLPAASRWCAWLARQGCVARATGRELACRPFGELRADRLRAALRLQPADDDRI